MPGETSAVNSSSPTGAPTETAPGAPPAPVPAGLPTPGAQLSELMSGDIGAAVSAMVMMSSKEMRETSRLARDAARKSMEAQQRSELESMRQGATDRLIAGLSQAGLQIGSAACSFASAAPGADASRLQNDVTLAPKDLGDSTKNWLVSSQAKAKLSTDLLTATGSTLNGAATGAKAAGDFSASREDEQATAAKNAAEVSKRTADEFSDDVKDANESVKKCMDFLKEWNGAKNAANNAAIARA